MQKVYELDSWYEEKQSAYLYKIISDVESSTVRQILFLELAKEADKQSELWANELKKSGCNVPLDYLPNLRTRVVAKLIPWLGPWNLSPVLSAMKVRGMSLYNEAIPGAPGHAIPDNAEQVGRRHRVWGRGGNLRAAVFGVNDGLVSNTSLIFGVAGATVNQSAILLTGIAGLLAGALSMAAGEYISVRSQREMYEYQIAVERAELAEYPDEEAAELALIFGARGVPPDEAKRLAAAIIADPDNALDTLAREELGINPRDLGSPVLAAFYSFTFFTLGASFPILPFLFDLGPRVLSVTALLSGVALFGVGMALSLFTGRQAFWSGLRMFLIGAAAAGITYGIGMVLGVSTQ